MYEEIVTVATYPNLMSAQFFQTLLQENGIQAFLPDEFSAGTQLPAIVFTMQEIRLQVPNSQAAEARRILREMAERNENDEDVEECDGPSCDGEQKGAAAPISSEHSSAALVVGGLFALGLVLSLAYQVGRWLFSVH